MATLVHSRRPTAFYEARLPTGSCVPELTFACLIEFADLEVNGERRTRPERSSSRPA
jgi:hypothetical protein